MANADETPIFSHMLTNIAVDAKWSVPVLIKTMVHDKTENHHDAFSSGWWWWETDSIY